MIQYVLRIRYGPAAFAHPAAQKIGNVVDRQLYAAILKACQKGTAIRMDDIVAGVVAVAETALLGKLRCKPLVGGGEERVVNILCHAAVIIGYRQIGVVKSIFIAPGDSAEALQLFGAAVKCIDGLPDFRSYPIFGRNCQNRLRKKGRRTPSSA